jgi:hypothetical protein
MNYFIQSALFSAVEQDERYAIRVYELELCDTVGRQSVLLKNLARLVAALL